MPTRQALSDLETSYFQQTAVNFQLLDENQYGWLGQCYVTEFRRVENLADAVKCHVACRTTGEFFRVMAGTTTYAP